MQARHLSQQAIDRETGGGEGLSNRAFMDRWSISSSSSSTIITNTTTTIVIIIFIVIVVDIVIIIVPNGQFQLSL